MGTCYQNGKGIKQDKIKAFKYFKKSAKKGYIAAQNNLALLHENGEGTEKDLQKAIHWYERTIENGYQKAELNLNNLLSNYFDNMM